jgi:hypothetical protein
VHVEFLCTHAPHTGRTLSHLEMSTSEQQQILLETKQTHANLPLSTGVASSQCEIPAFGHRHFALAVQPLFSLQQYREAIGVQLGGVDGRFCGWLVGMGNL